MCEAGWFNCEMPEWFPFTGVTGEQPAVVHGFRWAATGPVYQLGLRAASYCMEENLKAYVWQDAHSATCSYSRVCHDVTFSIYILISSANAVGQVLFSPRSHSIWTRYEWICTNLWQMVGPGDRKKWYIFHTGWLKVGCGSGCGLFFKRNIANMPT